MILTLISIGRKSTQTWRLRTKAKKPQYVQKQKRQDVQTIPSSTNIEMWKKVHKIANEKMTHFVATKFMKKVAQMSCLFFVILWGSTTAFLACEKSEPQVKAVEKAPILPADQSLDPKADHYLFTFVQNGRSHTVASVDQVPQAFRARVSVTDVSLTPTQRQAHRVNYFADLTEVDADGRYRIIALSRYNAALGEGIRATLPPLPKGAVVLYSAEWCGFCQKTKAYFKRENIVFAERDVDKMPGASEELAEKLKKENIKAGGIPVSDWEGTIVVGYDTKTFDALKNRNDFEEKRKNSKRP